MEGGGEGTYRITQVFTGHGYFGDYLHRVGKDPIASDGQYFES